MKKFMSKIKLSGFDLGIVIAFVVITLLGAGAWWYLSGALQDAQTDVSTAKADFDKYSSNPQFHVVVSPSNAKTLSNNIELIKAQLLPVIQTQFQSKDNKLSSIRQEDPVAWKHDLDDEVRRLNTAAKAKSVTVPPNYYFGFSRYLNQSPSDEQTAVLSKQLLGIEQIANVLIGAQVKGIQAIRRTYEEDSHAAGGSGESGPAAGEDHLAGYAVTPPGGVYIAYPFEIDFETTSENYRTVIDGLIQSPYVFILRSLSVKNSDPNSPMINDLDRMAGTPASSVVDTSPGEVAATTSTKGPQYLFGNSTLQVKARIDMIEWIADLSTLTNPPATTGRKKGGP
jgi:hypothetical protein